MPNTTSTTTKKEETSPTEAHRGRYIRRSRRRMPTRGRSRPSTPRPTRGRRPMRGRPTAATGATGRTTATPRPTRGRTPMRGRPTATPTRGRPTRGRPSTANRFRSMMSRARGRRR